MRNSVVVYLSVMAFMSVLSFTLYGFDKFRATRGGRRIPERTLHILAFLGGWPGALYAQQTFRHKTQKAAFRMMFWLMVIFHCAVVGGIAFVLGGGQFT